MYTGRRTRDTRNPQKVSPQVHIGGMSKLGIIAPTTLVQFFKSLGVETIESDSDRASAVAITNAVSAAPGGIPLFPILVHGGLDFSGANAWLRAMTVTRGYRIVVLGGDAEKFANAGDVVHIPLPASMQDIFQYLESLSGIAANNRFGNIQIQEDFGIVNLETGVAPEVTEAPVSAEEELPSDLLPTAPPAPVADAPSWVQAATPAQQPAPQVSPEPSAPVTPPVQDAPAWATTPEAPSAAPTPAAQPEEQVAVVEPTPVEPTPAPLPHDFYPAPAVEVPSVEPVAETEPVAEPVAETPEPNRPLTRRELAARAAQAQAEEPAVPAWASGQVEPMTVDSTPLEPISTEPATEAKPVTTAIPFGTGPSEERDIPQPSGPRPMRVFDPYSGTTSTTAAEQAPALAPAEPTPVAAPVYTPEPAPVAPVAPQPEPVAPAPVAEPAAADFDAPPTGEPVAVPGWATSPAPAEQPVYDAPAAQPQYEAPQPAHEAPAPQYEAPAPQYEAPQPVQQFTPAPTTPAYQQPAQTPVYTEPPAYVAPVLEERQLFAGPRAKIIASFAAKGGVTKTTSALVMADKAAKAGLRTVIIDMDKGQDNVGSYMRLRSASLPTIFDAAASGNPAAALVTPVQYQQYRNEASGALDFAVVFGPGNAHASNHPSLTSQVYRDVIDFAAANSDLVILDMQILKADKSASRLFYDVVLPLLKEEAWGLGIIDQSRPGLEDLEARLKELQREGLTRDRMLIMAANTVNFNDAQAQSLTKRFRTFGDFVGATSRDDAFKAQLNVGRIPSDNPAVSATMDAILLRVTENQAFAPQEKKKKRRGFFGR